MKNPRPTKKQKIQPNLILYSVGFDPDIINKILYLIENNQEVKNKGIKDKHIIWTLLYWKQYLPITEICVTLGISPKTFLNYYSETIHTLWVVCKAIMEERYEQLVESVGFLKHPVSKVIYRAIAADSTSINIETPTDLQVQKKFYSDKNKSHVMKYHSEVSATSYRLLLLHPEGFPGSVHDLKIADKIYMVKDQSGEPQYYSNGQMIRRHDNFPILVISTTYRGNLEHLNKIILILSVLTDLQETYNDGFDYQFDKQKLKEINEKRSLFVVK
ncbi:hypothetical protein RB653_004816 [Dictyostelium firmibasis]|uniref:DDE Tnp4 domain-containing protein n=1 Tax=Dictyostelium firmibasis TaxID=79012 RepID=A0AAN7U8D4_9MYCE